MYQVNRVTALHLQCCCGEFKVNGNDHQNATSQITKANYVELRRLRQIKKQRTESAPQTTNIIINISQSAYSSCRSQMAQSFRNRTEQIRADPDGDSNSSNKIKPQHPINGVDAHHVGQCIYRGNGNGNGNGLRNQNRQSIK